MLVRNLEILNQGQKNNSYFSVWLTDADILAKPLIVCHYNELMNYLAENKYLRVKFMHSANNNIDVFVEI